MFFFNSHKLYSQLRDGTNCGKAVILPLPAETCNRREFIIREKEMWFEFHGSGTEVSLKLSPGAQNPVNELTEAILFRERGGCPDLEEIKKEHIGRLENERRINFERLEHGVNYKLKLVREVRIPENFEMCLMREMSPCEGAVFIENTTTGVLKTNTISYVNCFTTTNIDDKMNCTSTSCLIATVCQGNNVTFYLRLTSGLLSSYANSGYCATWFVDNNQVSNCLPISTSQPNSFTANFPVSGTRTIEVKIFKSDGSFHRTSGKLNVNVNSNPTITLSASKNSICVGEGVTIYASGAVSYSYFPTPCPRDNPNCIEYLIPIMGSTFTITPSVTTTYTVIGINANGCRGQQTITITVKPKPYVKVEPISSTICMGKTVKLTATGANSYQWSPSTGLNITTGSEVYASPTITTTYTVTGTDISGCVGQSSITITVNPKPTVVVTPANSTICPGKNIQLTASGANSYQWSPATGLNTATGSSVIASPSVTTVYTVTGRVTSTGCSNTASSVVNVTILPMAGFSFSPSSGCKPLVVNFTNQSTNATSYIWNFGDGTAITSVKDPSHTYSNAGTFTITLTATNSCGSNAITHQIIVNTTPTAQFISSPSTVCINTIVNFTNKSTNATSYLWNFGDGTTSTVTNPSHTYTTSGTYTISLTATNNCGSNIITHQIIVKSKPTAKFTFSPNPACTYTSVTFTNQSTNATSYLWNFGDGTTVTSTNPSHSYSTAGTYTITLTATNSCGSNVMAHQININSSPNEVFYFDTYNNVEGEVITFQLLPPFISNIKYTWDFMDGTTLGPTTSTSPVTHTFNYPGYYRVTLTSSNNTCGTFSFSSNIYIIPSQGNYTPSRGCLSNYNYTHNVDKIITGNETWTSATPITIKQRLIIKAGGTLTISNGTKVQFGPQGMIIVERAQLSPFIKAGQLILNGATLSGIELTCKGNTFKMMWQGIEVWGNTTQSSTSNYQGKIVINNSTIEDAYTGVLLGKNKLVLKTGSTTEFLPNGHEASYGGGIIEAKGGSIFNRCNISIKFYEYPNNTTGSSITACNFLCKTSGVNGGMQDPYFNTSNSDNYNNAFIIGHNPFLGTYNIANSMGRSNVSIELYGVRTVLIADNTFESAKNFIHGTDAILNIKNGTGQGNSFTNSYTAIQIYNSNPSFYGVSILNNRFSEFINGIVFGGSKNDLIKNNIFNKEGLGTQDQNKTGIFTEQTTNLGIVDNTFEKLQSGIICANTGTTYNLIGYLSNGNVFKECRIPIITEFYNSGLNIRCNQFFNTDDINYYRTWDIRSGTLANQGKVSDPNTVSDPAGNRFNQGAAQVRKNIDAHTNSKFHYYPHLDNFTVPDKYTVEGNVPTFDIEKAYFYFPFNVNDACGKTKTMATPDDLAEKKTQVDKLIQEYADMEKILDKGKTTELLELINNKNIPVNNLKEQLILNSPLSDTVIQTLINRKVPLPPQVFQDVIIPNSPVNDRYRPPLEKRISAYPPSISEKVKSVQTYNPSYRTLTSITRELNAVENERQGILDELIRNYIYNDSASYAVALLEQENTKEAKQGLVATYIMDRNFSAAETKLSSLDTNSQEDMAFKELSQIKIDLGKQNKSLWDMDSLQMVKVREIASMCPLSLASVNAKNILKYVLGEEVAPCPVNNQNQRFYFDNDNSIISEISEEQEMNNTINNYPNPAGDFTIIPYSLPEGTKGILKVYGIRGELVKEVELPERNNVYILSLKEFAPGLYIYCIIGNTGEPLKFQKLTVNK